MKTINLNNEQIYLKIFLDFKSNGGIITPMNTESARKFLQDKINKDIEPEDILYLFYHEKELKKNMI